MNKLLLVLLLSAFLLSGCGAKDNSPSLPAGTNQPDENISNSEQTEQPNPPEEPKLPEEPNQTEAEPVYIPANVTTAEDAPEEEPAGEVLSGETSSQQSLSERIAAEISSTEAQEKEVEKRQKEAETQGDMNVTAKEMYQLWDNTLNTIWKLLEDSLDKADMDALRKEESEWIASKDAEVQAAGEETGGGSLQPLVEAMKAAEMTKARVYELAKYAEGR